MTWLGRLQGLLAAAATGLFCMTSNADSLPQQELERLQREIDADLTALGSSEPIEQKPSGLIAQPASTNSPAASSKPATPETESAASSEPSAPTTESAASSEPATRDTVEVVALRRAPTQLSFELTPQEVRTVPGAFGDAFRAVGTLPGLTPIVSGLPFYYVRGAPPGNVGYRFDGIRLPTLFHVGIGPSLLQPAFVNSVRLQPGAYDARLGEFSGGFIEASAVPSSAITRAEGSLRLFDVGAFVETPFAEGRGSVALGGRYSYTAALLSLAAPDTVLDYRDFQARLHYDFDPRQSLTVLALGSYDLLGEETRGILDVDYGVEFYRLSAIYRHTTPEARWRSQATLGYDRSVFGFDSATRATSANLQLSYESSLTEDIELRAGASTNVVDNETVASQLVDPGQVSSGFFANNFPARTDTAFGAWLSSTWTAAYPLRISPGVRLNAYRSQRVTLLALEPRLTVDYSLSPSTALIAAAGVAHQPPSFIIPIGGLVPAGLDKGLQRTTSSSVGVRSTVWPGAQVTTNLFYNRFANMTDALGASSTGGGPDTDLSERSDGYAAGLEANFSGRLGPSMDGLFSYTLSRSVRQVARRRVYSQFDRTHVLNAALTYRFGRGYSLGARYLAYSGNPFVDDNGNASVGSTPRRSAFFQRVDARFEKRWDFEGVSWLAFVAEGLNVTLSREEIGPGQFAPPLTLPSIGLEGGF